MSSTAEDVTLAIIKRNSEELKGLSPEDRISTVEEIYKGVSTSIPQKGDVSPELQNELTRLEEYKKLPGTEAVKDVEKPLKAKADLQKKGIVTDDPLPAGDLEIGFGVDPAESLSKALEKHYGKPVISYKKGDDIFYVDPENKVVKKANPNILGAAGMLLPIAGDVGGTIAGGVAGAALAKTPTGVVVGEAAGSTLGTGGMELLRLYIGKSFGVHDLSNEEMIKEASKKGAIAGAATAATGGVIAAFKGVSNMFKGHIIDPNEALKAGLTKEQGQMVIDEVNQILGRKAIRGTLFKLTDDPVSGAAEAEVRKTAEHAKQFIDRDLADQTGLNEALAKVAAPTPEKGGAAVQDVMRGQVRERIAKGEEIVAKNAKELESRLSTVTKERVGEPTRNVILEKQALAKEAENAAWEDVKKAGFNEATQSYDVVIPIGENVKRMRLIGQRQSKTAFTDVRRESAGIFSGKAKAANLADYNSELTALRADLRAVTKNKQFGNPEVRTINGAIQSMVEDRRLALIKAGREDLLKLIEAAEKKTAEFHKTYDRSIIGDLTAKDETGVYKIQSKQFVDRVLKGDKEEAKQLLTVIGDQPSIMNQWKEGISNSFERDVIQKLNVEVGTPLKPYKKKELIAKTKDWVEQHKDVLEEFFTKDEIGQIQKTGELAVLVKKQIAQQERIIKNAEKTFGRGKLTSLDPDALVKFVTDGSGSFVKPSGEGIQVPLNKINFVKGITKNHPGAWDKFQQEYSTGLQKKVFDTQKGLITPKKMDDLVNKEADVIIAVLGKEYYENLAKINKAVQILSRTPKSLRQEETARGIKQVIRGTVAPPLTKEGRIFTAALVFNEKRVNKVIAESLLNPEYLKKVVKLSEHKRFTRETAELAASLGFIE